MISRVEITQVAEPQALMWVIIYVFIMFTIDKGLLHSRPKAGIQVRAINDLPKHKLTLFRSHWTWDPELRQAQGPRRLSLRGVGIT